MEGNTVFEDGEVINIDFLLFSISILEVIPPQIIQKLSIVVDSSKNPHLVIKNKGFMSSSSGY